MEMSSLLYKNEIHIFQSLVTNHCLTAREVNQVTLVGQLCH